MALEAKTAEHLKKILGSGQVTEVNFLLPDHNYVTASDIVEVDELLNQVVCKGRLFVYRGSSGVGYETFDGTQYVPLEQIRSANHNGK